jgi:hypothetical protein
MFGAYPFCNHVAEFGENHGLTVETGPFGRSEIRQLWDGTHAAETLECSVPGGSIAAPASLKRMTFDMCS